MTGTGPLPPPLRASDAERERVLRVLRDAAVEGRLAHESFVRRVDSALRARDRGALDELVRDLPAKPTARLVAAVRESSASLGGKVSSGLLRGHLPLLRLPERRRPVVTIGRSGECDLVVHDLTVSRRHAALRLFGDQWFIEDLGSTNGTRVNRLTVRRATAVGPGDVVGFGGTAYRLR
jgi:hypothetical protein